MKSADGTAKYFRSAFQAEIKARGRGIQKKLAEVTGISLGLICDLNQGRTRGTPEKHRLLAKALGYEYEDFIARGLQIEREKLGLQAIHIPDFAGEDVWEEKFRLAQQVIAAQEKIIAALEENSKLRLEIEALKKSRQDSEELRHPSADGGDGRSASFPGAECDSV